MYILNSKGNPIQVIGVYEKEITEELKEFFEFLRTTPVVGAAIDKCIIVSKKEIVCTKTDGQKRSFYLSPEMNRYFPTKCWK
jgi:hypothetical protein